MPDQDYHCYLLNSLSSTTKTYVGYTVNPFRRIKQHNGQIKGGARYTSRFRPWKFIAIVHGFPTSSDGLKFEWAFQNPKRSTIFRHGLNRKKNGKSGHGDASMGHSGMVLAGMMENRIDIPGKLRLLMILLCESSYRDQPLTVYFFDEEHLNIFEDLFVANQRMAMYSDSESSCSESDEEEGVSGPGSGSARSLPVQPKEKHQWCCELPSQMKSVLVEKVEELPFFAALKGQKKKGSKRKKKTNENDNDDDGDDDNDDECLNQDQDVENRHCNIPIPVHFPAYNSDIHVDEQIDRLSIDMDASHIQNIQESEFSDDSSGTIDLLSHDDDDKNDDNDGSDFFGDDDDDDNNAITEVNDSECVIQMDCSTATVTTPIRPKAATTTAIAAATNKYAGPSSSSHRNSVIDLTCGLSPMSISSPSPVPVRRGLRVGQNTSSACTNTLGNNGDVGISAPPPYSLNGKSSTYNYLDLSDDDGDYGDDGDSSASDGTIDLCSP